MTPNAARILGHLDSMLESAIAQGHQPQHWVIREADWREIRESGNAKIGNTSYEDIPIHFSKLNDGEVVGMVYSAVAIATD